MNIRECNNIAKRNHAFEKNRHSRSVQTNLIDLWVPRHDLENASTNDLRLVDVATAACSQTSEGAAITIRKQV
jgi:hypothetical protein